jgi:hypothetical protein
LVGLVLCGILGALAVVDGVAGVQWDLQRELQRELQRVLGFFACLLAGILRSWLLLDTCLWRDLIDSFNLTLPFGGGVAG